MEQVGFVDTHYPGIEERIRMRRGYEMPQRQVIVGRPALVVVDLQAEPHDVDGPIAFMPGYESVVDNSLLLVDAARRQAIPVIYIQEVHSRTHVDFGRELDGREGVHDLEDDPSTCLVRELEPQPDEYLVKKRRYSAFFGTDLQILLGGLKAETLVLCGGLTEVCVLFTFIDAHQYDYYVRVAEDAVIGGSPAAHQAALDAMDYFQTGSLRSTGELVSAFREYKGPPRPTVKAIASASERK